jgi:hypothetical protein
VAEVTPKWTLANKVAVAACVLYFGYATVQIVRAALGVSAALNEWNIVMVGFGIVFWSFLYAIYSKAYKRAFGTAYFVIGFGIMVWQLYTLQGTLKQHDLSGNVALLVASTATMSKGVKDIIDASDETGEPSVRGSTVT